MLDCIAAGEWVFHLHLPWELFFQGLSIKCLSTAAGIAGDGG